MTNKYSEILRKMPIPSHPIGMAVIKKTTNSGKDVGKRSLGAS